MTYQYLTIFFNFEQITKYANILFVVIFTIVNYNNLPDTIPLNEYP